jgi:hypothetical protein
MSDMLWPAEAEEIVYLSKNFIEAIGYKDAITELFDMPPSNRAISRNKIENLTHNGKSYQLLINTSR